MKKSKSKGLVENMDKKMSSLTTSVNSVTSDMKKAEKRMYESTGQDAQRFAKKEVSRYKAELSEMDIVLGCYTEFKKKLDNLIA